VGGVSVEGVADLSVEGGSEWLSVEWSRLEGVAEGGARRRAGMEMSSG
jgi:hypothetical protein